ncbi:L-2-hydroxyglutarate oxidase [Halalkalibacterium ligniniphilum]|uniref:L-2-hydroxyglutarate oxidase n=1 Tax=Halalkalibacterium ligniniphilum TaxID=1134413 RepID=UPI00034A9BCF|nr:L-2-hydroxyglutarate oxidase [Halalkalibacterium ligniniphilum]
MYDFTIIGGGIVGLAVGHAIYERYPRASVLIIEKEQQVAAHQTGHNSGVIHSGIYYKPGSFKAKFAKAGSQSMTAFCKEHDLDVDICGKVIVATKEKELPLLDNLYKRGLANGLDISMLNKEEVREVEPYVNGLAAISVPAAGIVSYKQVAEKLAELIIERGGEIQLATTVEAITENSEGAVVETDKGTFHTSYLINCAGLHSDRIAKLAGYHVDMKIVPFRGEYYKLRPEKRYLVNNLIYPVPNPDFPFLGVHFTRMIDGEVDAGPNAVLSFKREGYKKTDIDLKDLSEVLRYKGFWQLASKYLKEGTEEMIRSFSKKKFVENLQQLIPEVKEDDLVPGPSGVRAQALTADGKLVDDFQLIRGRNSLHVCNAPSPAATASLEIGKAIVEKI